MAEIVTFTEIRVWIPQRLLRKLFKTSGYLKAKEYAKLLRKMTEIEHALGKLEHAKSVVEKLLLRGSNFTKQS